MLAPLMMLTFLVSISPLVIQSDVILPKASIDGFMVRFSNTITATLLSLTSFGTVIPGSILICSLNSSPAGALNFHIPNAAMAIIRNDNGHNHFLLVSGFVLNFPCISSFRGMAKPSLASAYTSIGSSTFLNSNCPKDGSRISG